MDSGAWRATVCGLERIEHDRETHTFTFQETGGIALSGWKIMHFLLINSGHFLSSAAFSWSNWEQYFLELTCLIFQKVLIVEWTPFQSLHIHNITFSG